MDPTPPFGEDTVGPFIQMEANMQIDLLGMDLAKQTDQL